MQYASRSSVRPKAISQCRVFEHSLSVILGVKPYLLKTYSEDNENPFFNVQSMNTY